MYPYGSSPVDNVDLATWVLELTTNNQTDWSNAAFSQGGDGVLTPTRSTLVTHIVTSDVMYLCSCPTNLEEARV